MPNIMFEVTKRCNLNCSYCYNVWKEKSEYPDDTLNLGQMEKLFRGLKKELNLGYISLSGGEPLMHKDIFKIIGLLKSLDIGVSLTSNALLLNESKIKKLIALGVKQFNFTLLAASADMHNRLCAHNKSYQRILQSITQVIKYGSLLNVSFLCLKQNPGQAQKIYDLSFALGAKSFTFLPFTPTGQAKTNLDLLAPEKKDLVTALSLLDLKVKSLKMPVFLGICIEPCLFEKPLKNISFTPCEGGKNKFAIDPAGNLRPCEQSSLILGNLLEESFHKLTKSKEIRNFRKVRHDKCYKCLKRFICRGGCRFSKH